MQDVSWSVWTRHPSFHQSSTAPPLYKLKVALFSSMSDIRAWSREFLTEFIELYKSLPCLWQVKSKEYSNKDKRNQAYAELIIKCKEVDRNVNKEFVTKKINSLRTVYRKELSKVKKSMRSGAGADEVYKPTLWYFDMLSFLNTEELS